MRFHAGRDNFMRNQRIQPLKFFCKYLEGLRLTPVNAELREHVPATGEAAWLVTVPPEDYDCEWASPVHYDKAMSAERDQVRLQVPERLQDDPDLLPRLRSDYHSVLLNTLIARGASATEAEELLADLWGDCVGRREDRPSLLEKFSGKCPLRNWLTTVATHRLVDLKRRQKHRGELSRNDPDDQQRDPFEQLPAGVAVRSEAGLVDLLKESLQAAFAKSPPDALLMLRLIYLNGLSQREVGRMWGWHESKVSRCLSQAMTAIETHTLRELKQRDAWLELAWQDFLELCESHQIGFL
jgi:RNA polymerase sigma factor (sigma-70 family)